MISIQQVPAATKAWVVNYCQHHNHPVNAALHLAGVPMVGVGLLQLVSGRANRGWTLIFLGYVFQFLGHYAQGNEVGEVTLAKKIWRRLAGPAEA
jgi:hypothetical protein